MKYLLLLAIAFAMMTACNNQKTVIPAQDLDAANLDTTVVPGNDFYQYATGGWQKANPIPDEYSRYGSFDKLREENQKQIQGLIEDLGKTTHKKGTNAQKVGDLYKIAMDSVKLNVDGAAPLKSYLEKVASVADKKDVVRAMASISKYAGNPFFGFYVAADDKNSSMNIAHLVQGGLGLGDRDYYIEQDDRAKTIREEYTKLIVKQFENTGFSGEEAAKAAKAILEIETEIAQAHVAKEMRRIPELNYHIIKTADLNAKVAVFEWDTYFGELGAQMDSLDVSQIEPITKAAELIANKPLEDLKAYLNWNIINPAASYLSDDFVNANFDFYGKVLSGSKQLRPRWKRAVDAVGGSLGEVVGQLYVEKYFPSEAKERMLQLVKNLRVSLGERIQNLEWMSDSTKVKAQEKLATFYVKIGYPDKWKDYSSLEIQDDSYLQNMFRASEFEYEDMLKDLGKPVDKDKWYMNPQTVNAYYNPTTNEICFPAGILQPPFFYMHGDDAINYGGIGVVIGHEMTHGFDDQGRKYDKEGNMADWWAAEDAPKFEERANVLVNHFNNIVVVDTVHANGKFTLGENIADYGGLQVSYNAFLKTEEGQNKDEQIDGFTPAQRFFLSYATLWAGNIRDAEILRLTKMDSHSLGRWRVNGMLPHIDAWYEAFDVQSDNALYLPKEKRAVIW
ncbi:MAG: M13 family metallopeptidase [Dysgonamonadaceae bacterium]|jgi:putative endopeptidase|nr:M13 family metallopeptidase [Dysgonamonadaceae bacterium]